MGSVRGRPAGPAPLTAAQRKKLRSRAPWRGPVSHERARLGLPALLREWWELQAWHETGYPGAFAESTLLILEKELINKLFFVLAEPSSAWKRASHAFIWGVLRSNTPNCACDVCGRALLLDARTHSCLIRSELFDDFYLIHFEDTRRATLCF